MFFMSREEPNQDTLHPNYLGYAMQIVVLPFSFVGQYLQ